MNIKPLYERLPTNCDLCIVAIEDAITRTGYKPPPVLLTVGKGALIYAVSILKIIGANTKEHPTAPYINLILDESLEPHEWYITINGKSVGSPSV
jgi:hypothetical protein